MSGSVWMFSDQIDDEDILGNVNSNTNHFDTSGVFISMLFRTTDFFALVTSF